MLASGFGLGSSTLAAQGKLSSRHAAEEHFERGVALYNEGNLDASLIEFERAYELFPNYKLLFNLGQLQLQRHEYVVALDLYQRYLEEGGDEIDADRRELVQSELERLNARIATLWVSTNRDGAVLYVDGERVGTLPLDGPMAVNAGLRTIRVEKPGFHPHTEQVKVAGGDRLRANVVLQQASSIAEEGRDENDPLPASKLYAPVKPDHTPAWIALAATGVLTGAATTFGILASTANADLDDKLDRYPGDASTVEDARSKTRTYALLTDACAAAALVGAGISLYLWLDPPTEERPKVAGARLWVTPTGLAGHF